MRMPFLSGHRWIDRFSNDEKEKKKSSANDRQMCDVVTEKMKWNKENHKHYNNKNKQTQTRLNDDKRLAMEGEQNE